MIDPIGTNDLDTLKIEGDLPSDAQRTLAESLLREFGRTKPGMNDYYLEFVDHAMVFIPRRSTWIRVEGTWPGISVTDLEAHENVASKLFSAFTRPPRKKDLIDVRAALDQKLVRLQKVLDEADRIFEALSMDARSDRFAVVYRNITEEIIPDYGPGTGTLAYSPPEE